MIFNKDSKGTAEVKAIIGFIYASISFDNLMPFIELAKEDLVNEILGDEFYASVEAIYADEEYDPTSDDVGVLLVKKVQNVIAFGAYQFFAKGNDVQHTQNGRMIFVDENLKPAFGHHIDADDANLQNLYDKHVNILLRFLDVNIDDDAVKDWKDTDQYKLVHNSIINTAEKFNDCFDIESSRKLFIKLSPIKRRIENGIIKSTIGVDLFEKIKGYVLDPTEDLSDSELVIMEQCKMPLAMFTMAQACLLLPARILPDRIVMMYSNEARESGSQSSKNVALNDRQALSLSITKVGNKELATLQQLVKKYNADASGVVVVDEEEYFGETTDGVVSIL